LTIGELPQHNHWITPNVSLWASASQRNSANQNIAPQLSVSGYGNSGDDGAFFIDRLVESLRYVANTGSSYPHNNLVPYTAIYMWLRTL